MHGSKILMHSYHFVKLKYAKVNSMTSRRGDRKNWGITFSENGTELNPLKIKRLFRYTYNFNPITNIGKRIFELEIKIVIFTYQWGINRATEQKGEIK